ncbi:2-hydroxychromene-2-carboxylate isomerase [Streptomyces sp. NBC_01244]|uniref:2-hydroxychromene-2-carboxylate isomerase n=1 Tax=Streptomyces sp. NBC_01244 TaxID=2903797 RepID=UPI002E0E37D5|nr:2-hydroxychromene-2-carboxylate isomerase [Streptomyces sp. NBC_01244]
MSAGPAAAGPRRRTRRPPRFYFSLRSPYSWLAYRELLDRHRELAGRIEWVPFFEPDELSLKMLRAAGGEFPYTAMSAAKHRYILQDVRRLAAERGLEFGWPVDREPVWEVPHLGYLAAARHGKGPEYIALAARARWQDGLDVCDPGVVAGFGAELGIDPDELSGAARDPELREAGVRALLDVDRDGVFGVPFFTDHFDKYWGLDRLPAFVSALTRRFAAEPAPAPEPAQSPRAPHGPSFDDGHAGGCG